MKTCNLHKNVCLFCVIFTHAIYNWLIAFVQGISVYDEGDWYDGEWEDGQKTGIGARRYKNGAK